MAGPTIVHEDPTLRIAIERNVLINVWRDAPTVEQMRAFGSAARSLHRSRGGDGGLINVVVGGTPRFSDGVRDEAVRLTRAPMLPRGVVHLILVNGLAGAAVRAFLSTVVLLGRPRVPTRVYADPDETCAFLAPLLTVGKERWTAAELFAVYQQAVRRQAPRPDTWPMEKER
ncbi:MAG: hypothetical protein ABI193_19825 [Minicystis sp.]